MVMYQGEIRNLGISISNSSIASFTIDNAKYAIIDSDDNVILNGDATIDKNNIYVLFNADKIDKYTIEFIYKIGLEVMKAKLYLEVIQ